MSLHVRAVFAELSTILRWLRNCSVVVLATPTILTSQIPEQGTTRQIRISGAFPALRLTPTLTLTDAVLDTRHVSSVVVSAVGDVVVADGSDRLIVFSAAGARLRVIGRAGAGPGEFKGPLSVGWLHDTLVALDQIQRRLSLFSLQTGTLLTSFPWSIRGRPERLLNGGTALYAVVESRTGVRQPVFNGTGALPPSAEFGIAPVTSSGIGPTIAQLRDSVDRMTGSDCQDKKGDIWSFDSFFPDHGSMRALTPSGQLVTGNRDGNFLAVREGGRPTPVAMISGPALRLPVTDAIWDSVAAKYHSTEKTAGITRCAPPVIRPVVLPALRAVATDEVGTIWVEVADRVGTALNGLRADGTVVGGFHLPNHDETVPWVVRSGRLYLVLVDADGLQSIQVYRISR